MKKITLTVTNDLVTDQRIHRIANSLLSLGLQVNVIGIRFADSQKLLQKQYSTKRIFMIFRKTFLFYAEINIKLFIFLLFKKTDILVANDLDTLLPNFLVSVLRKKIIVYDSHELFTEVPDLQNKKIRKRIWEKLETWILPKIKYSYTVCNSIADFYNNKYGINMLVVRNLPYLKNQDLLIDSTEYHFSLETDKFFNTLPTDNHNIIIYQGVLNSARGLNELILAMKFINNAKLLLVGDGYLKNELKTLVEKENLSKKVLFIGKIPFEELFEITKKAQIGISIEKGAGLSYHYALPNKLFDYIQANLPVLASPLPEIKKIMDNYNIGMYIDNHEPEHIASKMEFMLKTHCALNLWKTNLKIAAKELCWENEEIVLKKLYQKITDL